MSAPFPPVALPKRNRAAVPTVKVCAPRRSASKAGAVSVSRMYEAHEPDEPFSQRAARLHREGHGHHYALAHAEHRERQDAAEVSWLRTI